MQIEIVSVSEEEKSILARLIELYEYDFTKYNNNDVNALGLFGYSYLDYYWTEERRFPYFIKVCGKLAGFALVCDFCYISKDSDTLFMAEFFVMRKYRRRGIGREAAKRVFYLHRGKWELTVHPQNPSSVKFWIKAIEECVGQDYTTFENVAGVYDDAPATAFTFVIK